MARIVLSEKILYARMEGYSYASSRRAAYRARSKVRDNIVSSGRIDTGRMLKSTQVKSMGRSRWKVANYTPYARFQEFGTRAHGPKTAKALRFKPKGATAFVFAKRVRGVTAARFFEKAMRSMTIKDWTVG